MLGIPFETEGSNVDEYFDGRPGNPDELVLHLAKLRILAKITSLNLQLFFTLGSTR